MKHTQVFHKILSHQEPNPITSKMENRPPIIVVVPDREDAFSESNVRSSEFFVSPLPQPRTQPASPPNDGESKRDISSKDDTASVETESVASDIDSSFDGSVISSMEESVEEEEEDESREFELELKKLKLLRQQQAQQHLINPQATHPCAPNPFAQHHGVPRQDSFRHPQLQAQLHPAQEKKLRGMAMQEQAEMIQEIHSMLSLLIDDQPPSQTSGSSSNSSMKKSRSRNATQSKRDIAILAKDKLSKFENDVQSLRQAESYDARDSSMSSYSFKAISAPPLWLESDRKGKDEMVVSKRLVKPDDISSKLLDRHTTHAPQRASKPQRSKSGKIHAQSLHENFSSSFNLEKSPHVQKAMRQSSHSRSTPVTPSMHERFSGSYSSFASFDYEQSPQVQKALRMSSHRRKMPVVPNMHDRFSQSLNLERSSMVPKNTTRRHSLQVPTLTVDERFSEHFELELEPDDEEQSVEAMPEPTKSPEPQKASVLSSLASRFTKSPVIQKALKLSSNNRTPRRTRKGTKSTRSSTPMSNTSSQTLNKRSKKRAKSGKGSKDVSGRRQPKPTEEQERPKRTVTPESSRHSRLMVASPGMDKSMIGEKLHKQIHKTQPDLAGRITDVLMNYNNAEELMHMLEGPEEDMTERIVEVLEVLQGRGSSRPKQTIKA